MKMMKTKFLTTVLIWAVGLAADGATYWFSFSEQTNAVTAGVTHYTFVYSASDDAAQGFDGYVAIVGVGTNRFDVPADLPNGRWVRGMTTAIQGGVVTNTGWCPSVFYDTNQFNPPPVTNEWPVVTPPGEMELHKD